MNDTVFNSLLIYIFSLIIVFCFKPKFLFSKKTKEFKQFGFNKNQTIIPFVLFCSYFSIIIFLLCRVYDKFEKSI